jgi:hypothetical protein
VLYSLPPAPFQKIEHTGFLFSYVGFNIKWHEDNKGAYTEDNTFIYAINDVAQLGSISPKATKE